MKHDQANYDANAAVSGRRRSSAAEVTRVATNSRQADLVPAAVGATRRTSVQYNSQLGHAENHRKGETFVAKGAKASPQVRGRNSSRPTKFGDKDVLGSC